jgi:hypothetical protein
MTIKNPPAASRRAAHQSKEGNTATAPFPPIPPNMPTSFCNPWQQNKSPTTIRRIDRAYDSMFLVLCIMAG